MSLKRFFSPVFVAACLSMAAFSFSPSASAVDDADMPDQCKNGIGTCVAASTRWVPYIAPYQKPLAEVVGGGPFYYANGEEYRANVVRDAEATMRNPTNPSGSYLYSPCSPPITYGPCSYHPYLWLYRAGVSGGSCTGGSVQFDVIYNTTFDANEKAYQDETGAVFLAKCPNGADFVQKSIQGPGSCNASAFPAVKSRSSVKCYLAARPQPEGECSKYGNPCNPATGAKTQEETDYAGNSSGTPGFTRQYNSQFNADVGLGRGWFSSVHKRLVLDGGFVWANRNATQTDRFSCASNPCNPLYFPGYALKKEGSEYLLLSKDGTSERYSATGTLLFEYDRTGAIDRSYYYTNGQLTSVISRYGHTLQFTYYADGHLQTLTDPGNNVYTYFYDTNNNLVRVNYPDGTARLYHYENGSHPNALTGISNVDSGGATTRYSSYGYDNASGLAISTELAGGQQRFTLSYDSSTQTTVTDAAGTQQVLTFEKVSGSAPTKNLIKRLNKGDNKALTQKFNTTALACKQDEEGRVTTYVNGSISPTYVTEGQSGNCNSPASISETRTTTYTYQSYSLEEPFVYNTLKLVKEIRRPSVSAGKTFKTIITYGPTGGPSAYLRRSPVKIDQNGFKPDGTAVVRTVIFGYNAAGQVTSINGPRTDVSDVTTLAYHSCTTGGQCGQLQRITNALGQVTTFDTYDGAGRVLSMTDPNGLVTAYTYDPRGRVLSLTQSGPGVVSRTSTYTYNAAGNVTFMSLPGGRTLTYTYNAAQELTRVTDQLGNYVAYGYDARGNRNAEYTHDSSGTLVRQLDIGHNLRNQVDWLNAAGSVTVQLRDAIGNLTSEVAPKDVGGSNPATTAHQYDALNRLFKTIDRLSGHTDYGYDVNDRVTSVKAPNDVTTQYVYDDLGNLLKEISPDRGTLTYTHDAAGNVKSVTDARGIAVNYTYDALNRVTLINYPNDPDVTLTYDTAPNCTQGLGRLCQVTDASGQTNYGYDAFGNVIQQIKNELGISYVTDFSYDAADRVLSVRYPDGRMVGYTRDALGRIDTVKVDATPLINSRSYRADGLLATQAFANGLNESRQYNLKGELTYQSLGAADTRVYGYDLNGNLENLQTLPGTGSYTYDGLDRLDLDTWAGTTRDFDYDPNGNRTKDNTVNYLYTAGSNRLTAGNQESFTYDAAGNITGRSPVWGGTTGTATYPYDEAGRLKRVEGRSCTPFGCTDTIAGSYVYDYRNLRTRKDRGSKYGGLTIFHYDLQGRLILETDGNGNAQTAYIWDDTAPVAQVSGGSMRYLHTDHLNTPRLATDASQTVVWRWEGKAFGDAPPTGSATVNLRFPGQYYDAESGLHYNWNRYYDPKIGRYVTSDPIGLAGGNNTYSYTYGNPLGWIDPTGLAVVGQWWQEPTVKNLQVWACDRNGTNCSSHGGIRHLITLHFRAEGEIEWSILCTDTCTAETWFVSGSSGTIPLYPISIPIPMPSACKVLPPGPARTTCQAAAAANMLRNIGKHLGQATEIAKAYYGGLAETYKRIIDPTTYCQIMPRDPGWP